MHNTNELISKLKTDAMKYWLSPAEVDSRLAELAHALGYSGLGVEVLVEDVIHKWGNAFDELMVSIDVNSVAGIKMSLFRKGGEMQSASIVVQQNSHLLTEAMLEVWDNQYRNQHGGLTLKTSGAVDMFFKSIPYLGNQNGSSVIALIYVDLDRFKQINDRISHPEGDRALRNVYSCMHETARELDGLAFFDGGDEFILATTSDQPMKIALALWHLRKKLQNLAFHADTDILTIDMTAGVVVRSVDELFSNYENLKKVCESLTKQPGGSKEKKRGTITFERLNSQEQFSAQAVNPKHFFQLGISLSRSGQFVHRTFGDDRLNFIAYQVTASCSSVTQSFEQLEQVVKESIDWLDIKIGGSCSEHHLLISGFGNEPIPKHAIALAVMHGLSRVYVQNERSMESAEVHPLNVIWDDSIQAVSVTYNSQVVWGDSIKPSGVSGYLQTIKKNVMRVGEEKKGNLSFGPFVRIGTENKNGGAIIGVQIGFDAALRTPGGNLFPQSFMVDYVRVDDRPRTGGGLPDFWQVALAQVVTAQGIDEIIEVLVWGVSPEDTETYKHLKGVKKWSIDEVSLLTGLPTVVVSKLEKNLSDKVKIVRKPEDLLQKIFDAYQKFSGRENEMYEGSNLSSGAVLRRAMAKADPLGQSEGIVCPTAALAYPIVIDTLRKSDCVRQASDDANQDQRELIAFKIKLTDPLVSKIPTYLSNQEHELDSYAKKVLLDRDGFFRAKLENSGREQINGFIALLSSYVKSTNNISTRRACLIVPNEFSDNGELRPLGLISVWATPRNSENGEKLIDFVYVWRTVEAFIGLPYSLYGSIELARQLVELVNERVSEAGGNSKSSKLGELTYIALSLHLGGDKFHMRVAKQIVDSASD